MPSTTALPRLSCEMKVSGAARYSKVQVKTLLAYFLVIHDLSTIGNVVVYPLGVTQLQADAAVGDPPAERAVLQVERVLVVQHRMEQVVTVELRVVIAGVAMAKAVAAAGDGVLARRSGRIDRARTAIPILHELPVTAVATEHRRLAAIPHVVQNKPTRGAAVALRLAPHGKLVARQLRLGLRLGVGGLLQHEALRRGTAVADNLDVLAIDEPSRTQHQAGIERRDDLVATRAVDELPGLGLGVVRGLLPDVGARGCRATLHGKGLAAGGVHDAVGAVALGLDDPLLGAGFVARIHLHVGPVGARGTLHVDGEAG